MKKIFYIISLFFFCNNCIAQTQRALIIGIDEYAPPAGTKASAYRGEWPTLDGCKNDAQAMKAIIVNNFAFPEKNIKELYNKEATRDAILNAMEALINECADGDIAFIYYAGHGSQVKNSFSKENDFKDESLVPVDTWKEGVADIRDKELAKVFNRFIDKKIKLTLIFDCCHSGSIARGLYQPKYRYIASSNVDVKDNSNPQSPEGRKNSNFLVMSASQDNEYAQEQIDENNLPHGAFTLALIKALNQQSSKTSVQNIFNSIKAILKSNGKSQEPVLAGDEGRYKETLFGLDKAQLPGKSLVPVIKVTGNNLVLQGGFATGINVDNELARVINNDTVRLRITKITGINQSEAVVINGDAAAIAPGQLFEVTNWVSSNAPLLNIYIPTGNYSYADVIKLAAVNAKLKKQEPAGWINTFENAVPDLTINIADNRFILTEYAKGIHGSTELKDYSVTGISHYMKGKKLFINLPAPKALVDMLQIRFKEFKTFRFVSDPAEAHYILYGTIDNNEKPGYGLLKSDISLKDSLPSMPIYTALGILSDSTEHSYKEVTENIFENALKLSKTRGWINLSSPNEADFFPYHLTMINTKTKKPVDVIKVDDLVSLNIEADNNYLEKNIKPKYIYVFIIDSKGQMQLLYPSPSSGNTDNKFPYKKEGVLINSSTLIDGLQASVPVGTDSYFLLASADQITNYDQVFNQEGVRGIGERSDNPLSKLLEMGNESAARGLKNTSPVNWSLKKLFIMTKH